MEPLDIDKTNENPELDLWEPWIVDIDLTDENPRYEFDQWKPG